MKILHVAASYWPAVRYGGTIVSVHGLCRALAGRGHEVHVFTTNVDGPTDSDVPLLRPVEMDGVRVWYFPSPRLRRLYWSPAMARALDRQIAAFDVVHLHALFVWPVWAAAKAARRARVPYLVAPRGMLEPALMRKKNRLMKSVIMAAVGRRMIEGAALIHVTSAREAEEATAFGFALPPFVEIPNGVEPASQPAVAARLSSAVTALVDGPPFLLFIGRISWKKGLDRLVKALAHAPGLRLVIAGNDDEGYRSTIDRLAAVAGVGQRLVFCGPVDAAGKSALLARAQVLVLPSYSENFGNVVLEAMAAGCPVVVTPEVGIAEIVRNAEAGWVIEGTPQNLGAALAKLSADPELRAAMGARGRAAAGKFSWAAIAERMESAYRGILSDRSPLT